MTISQPGNGQPDLGPAGYARWRVSEIGAITERLERRLILELAGDVHGRTVLDVGCGDGDFALQLARTPATVTGIDSSAAMIDAARRRQSSMMQTLRFKLPAPNDCHFVLNSSTSWRRSQFFASSKMRRLFSRKSRAYSSPADVSLLGRNGNGAPGRRGAAFARGSARHYGAKDGSGQPKSFASSPSRLASSSRPCAEPSIIPAGLRRRAGSAPTTPIWVGSRPGVPARGAFRH